VVTEVLIFRTKFNIEDKLNERIALSEKLIVAGIITLWKFNIHKKWHTYYWPIGTSSQSGFHNTELKDIKILTFVYCDCGK
jgi:hypothetical protein